jgi:hypothetical protein
MAKSKLDEQMTVDQIRVEHRGSLVIEAAAGARITINITAPRPRIKKRNRQRTLSRGRERGAE